MRIIASIRLSRESKDTLLSCQLLKRKLHLTIQRLPKIKNANFGFIDSIAEQVIRGVVAGCREAGCALVGGETAEMGGLFPKDGGIYDINGTASGAIAKGKQLLPHKAAMRPGDVLLGLASSGCHSNGFSLIRKIIQERAGLSYDDVSPWSTGETIGESLLTPTRIYVKSVLAATEKDLIKGMAHITGGGLTENVPRMLPKHLAAVLDAATWKVPEVLKWLKKTGNITEVGVLGRSIATSIPISILGQKTCLEGP